MAVFHDADPQSQFNRDTGFAFTDPFGMRLKQGKDFVGVRNGFALYSAAANLVNLTFGMLAESVQISKQYVGDIIVIF